MRALILTGALASLAGLVRAGEGRVARDILGETEATAVAAVMLDAHVYANSQPGWADVRVLDRAGREVPRVVLPERDYVFEERHTARASTIKSVEQLPEGGLAVVCEIERTNAVLLTQLTVHTPLRNYEQTVAVSVPEGSGAWRQVKAAEPLFDYSRFADVKKETVDLPQLTNRLFRLVIGQADDQAFSSYTAMAEESVGGQAPQRLLKRYSVEKRPFRIDAVTFRDTVQEAVPREKRERVAAAGVKVTEDAARKTTVLTLDAARRPAVGLALDPEQKNFERAVTVEAPVPGGWQTVAEGRVWRSRLPGMAPGEGLEVPFAEVRTGALRVQIRNDDNPPLTFGPAGVALLRQVYRVAFIAEKGERYRLVYGDPEAKDAPVYEQGVTAYLNGGQKAALWRLSPAPEGKVAYGLGVRVRLFLAEHGMLLLSLLVMAVLGALILRAVRHVEKR